MRDMDFEEIFNVVPDRFNMGIIEFQDISRIIIDEVVVLLNQRGFLKLGVIRPKLVLGNEPAIKQQFNGVVECCPADPVFMIFHPDVKRFDIKMSIRSENLF